MNPSIRIYEYSFEFVTKKMMFFSIGRGQV